MKRSAALASLSRDHHTALVAAQRLKRATPETQAEVREGYLAYWRAGGLAHFQLEEELLLPGYAAYGDPHHPTVLAVLGDHVDIRQRTHALERLPDPGSGASSAQDPGSGTAPDLRLGSVQDPGSGTAPDLRLGSGPEAELAALHELGERMAAHVRLEERELFPIIEQAMPERELSELAKALQQAEAASRSS